MNLRQLCNIAFAAEWERLSEEGQHEFLEELSMPLDPMAQAHQLDPRLMPGERKGPRAGEG